MAKSYDHVFKLLLIGHSGVGKTSLISRFCFEKMFPDDVYRPTFMLTVGIEYNIRTIELDGKKVKLQIWTTAGQERFQKITSEFCRGAMGIMLVYDVTDYRTFETLRCWIRNIKDNASAGVQLMILSNKCDQPEKREVSKDQGEALAVEYGIKFMETSAKDSTNVEEAFFTLARDIKDVGIVWAEKRTEKKTRFLTANNLAVIPSLNF